MERLIQLLDDLDHFLDMIGRGWVMLRAFYTECVKILEERFDKTICIVLKGDSFRLRIADGFIIDVVRDDIIIEIQTRRFSSIHDKLKKLVQTHEVRLIHPIITKKWVVYVDKETGKKDGKRKSPKTGKPIDLFKELIRIPVLVKHPNFSMILYMVQAEETRIRGEKKGWRGRGYKIQDRRIIGVDKVISLNHPGDYLRFLPDELGDPFTNKRLAEVAEIHPREAGWITYCLKKMGAIKEVGKEGRSLLFRRIG